MSKERVGSVCDQKELFIRTSVIDNEPTPSTERQPNQERLDVARQPPLNRSVTPPAWRSVTPPAARSAAPPVPPLEEEGGGAAQRSADDDVDVDHGEPPLNRSVTPPARRSVTPPAARSAAPPVPPLEEEGGGAAQRSGAAEPERGSNVNRAAGAVEEMQGEPESREEQQPQLQHEEQVVDGIRIHRVWCVWDGDLEVWWGTDLESVDIDIEHRGHVISVSLDRDCSGNITCWPYTVGTYEATHHLAPHASLARMTSPLSCSLAT